jgi:hypothetical protein
MKKDCSNPDNKKMICEEIFKVNNTLKKRIRKERDKFRKEQITEIEDLQQVDCRRMWQELKRLAGWTVKTKEIQAVLNDNQEEVRDEEALKVWENSFRKLGIEDLEDKTFDQEFARSIVSGNDTSRITSENEENTELDHEITRAEVTTAITMLQRRKAAGIDEITAEALKRGGEKLKDALLDLIQKAWKKEEIPEEWARGVICPIYKDGDPREPLNYRGITLLSIVGKVFSQILNNRLINWSEKNDILAEEQAGFTHERMPRSTVYTCRDSKNERQKSDF